MALKDVQSGDILQFRDFDVTTTIVTQTIFDNGRPTTETEEQTARRGHHTAIVDSIETNGVFWVLEQHVKPGGRTVQRHRLPTRDTTTTTTTTHKIAIGARGRPWPAKIIQTTTFRVKGSITAYRPQSRSGAGAAEQMHL